MEAGKKFEAVHPLNPAVIGVCTVVSNDEDVISFRFDDSDEIFNVMVDSTEIFPAGYCKATDHPLTSPKTYDKQSLIIICNLAKAFSRIR